MQQSTFHPQCNVHTSHARKPAYATSHLNMSFTPTYRHTHLCSSALLIYKANATNPQKIPYPTQSHPTTNPALHPPSPRTAPILIPAIPTPAAFGLRPGVYVLPAYGLCVTAGSSALASVFVCESFPSGTPHLNRISPNTEPGTHTYYHKSLP